MGFVGKVKAKFCVVAYEPKWRPEFEKQKREEHEQLKRHLDPGHPVPPHKPPTPPQPQAHKHVVTPPATPPVPPPEMPTPKEEPKPSGYRFANKDEQKKAIIEFLDGIADWVEEYNKTGDGADDWLDSIRPSETDLETVKDADGNDELAKAIQQLQDAGVDDGDIQDALHELAEAEVTHMTHEDNSIWSFPIGEREEQVSNISGIVNGKRTDTVFEDLCEGFTEKELEEIARHLDKCYWDGKSDYIHVDMSYDVMNYVVDPDALLDRLTPGDDDDDA
jgi:hypothetical protein